MAPTMAPAAGGSDDNKSVSFYASISNRSLAPKGISDAECDFC